MSDRIMDKLTLLSRGRVRRGFGRSIESAGSRALLALLVLAPLLSAAQAPDRSVFDGADRARADAEAADAATLSAPEFADAMSEYADALRDFEKGRDAERIQRSLTTAENLFRDAELNAIRSAHLTPARNLLAEARAAKTDRFAPKTTAKAEELLVQADASLIADRYDTNPAIELARRAEYEARHAMYIAALADEIRRKDLTAEDIILDWEAALFAIADTLQVEADMSAGPAVTRDVLTGYALELLELREIVAQQNLQISGLEDEIRELDARLGGAAEDRATLIRQVERQARIREQFDQIGELFEPGEAAVLRDGDDLIIRLVGLRFASNSAEIDPSFAPLMNKVDTAIGVFPQCRLTVEGHTDSKGKVERNQALSEERAQSVMDYMTGILKIPAFRIKAAGYGDTRPITSNRTDEGRAQNRRIDLIISPRPESLY